MDEELPSLGEAIRPEEVDRTFTIAPSVYVDGPLGKRLPSAIGHYRIVRLIGEGGMGVVYEAEQEHPRRTVALKVIRGATSPELLRRFELESEALARLQHPGIAQVYEAGSADTGFGPQPYFAMELIVNGKRLTGYAEAHRLKVRQRLELMAKVCDAVHHAHQRGIIHRDLKPGNILVDEHGHPKILDFGVARVTNSDTQATRQTDIGQLIGTLAYMSPEQALADPLELDTRSDVYTLGVILYEVLSLHLPYTLSKTLVESIRTIRETEPVPVSTFDHSFRGDIQTIVAKALEKDKVRRYSSAADFAADIRRYLKDEPIEARRASLSYQFQKFARRNKALVAGVAAVFLVLVVGIAVSTWQAVRARRAEQIAIQERHSAAAVNDFLQNDLLAQASSIKQVGPNNRPDPDLKVRTALDRAAARIAGKFGQQPEVEAAIHVTIGQTYSDLAQFPEARKQLERALELYRRTLGAENPKTISTMSRLGDTARLQGRYSEADVLLREALEIQRRVMSAEHPDTLQSMNNLARNYNALGKYAKAEALFSQTLPVQRRVMGTEHPDTLKTMLNLADTFGLLGKSEQANPLYSQTLAAMRRVLGPEHPDTLSCMISLAENYMDEGSSLQAEALLNQILELQRRVWGAEHPETLSSMLRLALTYEDQGKSAQAEALLSETLEIQRRVVGPEHPRTLVSKFHLADLYEDQGKHRQAEALYLQTLEAMRRVMGTEQPKTLDCMNGLANVYRLQGKFVQSEAIYSQTLEIRRRVMGPEHPDTLDSMEGLACVYTAQGKYAEAEPLLRLALAGREITSRDSWRRFAVQSNLGASLAGQKKYVEAEPLLVSGYEGMEQRRARVPVSSRSHLNEAGQRIVHLYQDGGKPKKAAEWWQKLKMTKLAPGAK